MFYERVNWQLTTMLMRALVCVSDKPCDHVTAVTRDSQSPALVVVLVSDSESLFVDKHNLPQHRYKQTTLVG